MVTAMCLSLPMVPAISTVDGHTADLSTISYKYWYKHYPTYISSDTQKKYHPQPSSQYHYCSNPKKHPIKSALASECRQSEWDSFYQDLLSGWWKADVQWFTGWCHKWQPTTQNFQSRHCSGSRGNWCHLVKRPINWSVCLKCDVCIVTKAILACF